VSNSQTLNSQAVLGQLQEKFEGVLTNPTNSDKVRTLVRAVLEALNLNASQCAVRLNVSPATVARWLAGPTIPHVREIRALEELVRAHFAPVGQTGVDFFGRALGIWRFDEFFIRALRAKRVYVLKNWMGFQAGMNSRMKDSLKNVFSENRDLRVCYAYLKGSEAATTFKNFYSEVAQEFPSNVMWSELLSSAKPIQMLGDVFASPFIMEYFDGRIDVLLEVPVRVLQSSDDNDLSGFTTILIELPDAHKHRLWEEWKIALAREFTIVNVKIAEEFDDKINVMRSSAYSIGESSADEFDDKSSFVVAEYEGQVVGSVRLTDSKRASPLKKWGGDKYPLPSGKGIVELTRGTVHPDHRGLQIYKWMMLRALREASKKGFDKATAAIEVEFRQKGFLYSLGFKPVGDVMTYDDLPRKGTKAQSLICDLKESAGQWETVEREFWERTAVKIMNT
jgi:GNAT superfamily N-acetyltransferase